MLHDLLGLAVGPVQSSGLARGPVQVGLLLHKRRGVCKPSSRQRGFQRLSCCDGFHSLKDD